MDKKIREIKRLIHYLLQNGEDRTCGIMDYTRDGGSPDYVISGYDWWNNSRTWDKYDLEPPPGTLKKESYGVKLERIRLRLVEQEIECSWKGQSYEEKRYYNTIRFSDCPKTIDYIHETLLAYAEPIAEKKAIERIKKEEMQRMLAGHYERLELLK